MKRNLTISLSILAMLFLFSVIVLNANSGAPASSEKFYEEEIILENWMFELSAWYLETMDTKTELKENSESNTSEEILISDSLLKVLTEPSDEEEIKLESWMNDLSQW
ncbi:MAG: hypothetical protein IPM71_08695 [Bacteroidota bacterium]|nr:MAG: hypothetical protein IPM71_08695 [Bacteroidota bacterium]